MNKRFVDAMEECPIIAAIKNMDGLNKCLQSDCNIVFVLYGDICTISDIVKTIKESGRIVIVHIDLVNGLSSKEISVDFIKNNTEADGIISTKLGLIKRAKELGLFTVLRFFIIDSMAIENIKKQSDVAKPDYIEILPGSMPKVIKKIKNITSVPIIAGGLITDKEDVMAALSGGAVSISTTNQEVWFM
jgi:glycerol-3-phosphate responsive antiterminator